METKKERKTLPRDYLNNTNPYAPLSSYDHSTNTDEPDTHPNNMLVRLEATRRIQPEITPLADIEVLASENEAMWGYLVGRRKEAVGRVIRGLASRNYNNNGKGGNKYDGSNNGNASNTSNTAITSTVTNTSNTTNTTNTANTITNTITSNNNSTITNNTITSNTAVETDEDAFAAIARLRTHPSVPPLSTRYLSLHLLKNQHSLHEKAFRGFNDVLAAKKFVLREPIAFPITKVVSNLSEALLYRKIVERYEKGLRMGRRDRRKGVNGKVGESYERREWERKSGEERRKEHYGMVEKMKEGLLDGDRG